MPVKQRLVVGLVALALALTAAGCGGGSEGSAGSGGSRNAAGGSYRSQTGDGPPVRVFLKNDTDTPVQVGDPGALHSTARGWSIPARGSVEQPIVQPTFLHRLSPDQDFVTDARSGDGAYLHWDSYRDGRVVVALTRNELTYGAKEVTVRRDGDTQVLGSGRLRLRVRRVYDEMGSGNPQMDITVVNG